MTVTINGTTGINSPGGDVSVSQTLSGNLTFTGTGNRITGDFSNGTFANRVLFQNSITNGLTSIGIIPNGTATISNVTLHTSSDPANTSIGQLSIDPSSTFSINSGQRGTGTFIPLTFITGGSERMRIDTSGNVGIGTSSPATKMQVSGGSVTELRITSSGDISTGAAALVRFGGSNSQTSGYAGYGGAANSYDIWNTLAGPMVFGTSNAERMRIDSSGAVCVGTATSLLPASGRGNVTINGSASTILSLGIAGASVGYLYHDGTGFYINSTPAAAPMVFQNAGAERMRIDSSGNLLVGTTTSGIPGQWGAQGITVAGNFSSTGGMAVRSSSGTGTQYFIGFGRNGNELCGNIQSNGTNSTSYNTSSDYRLKENIKPMQNALAVVQQLNPVTYTWKADGSDGQGFIAHELQNVVPDCVSGEKDAVDEDGKPVYQGIDTSFLVATLTKAIQELTARIEQLEAK